MRWPLLLAVVAACAEPVSPEPLGDYTGWKRFDVLGPAPGHGDTYRIIYANPIAADPDQDFIEGYAEGAILVKEIRNNDGGTSGALRYVAIMRRDPFDPALAVDGGWLFTQADEPGGDEVHPSFCWNRCHAAAPYAGAWYDYRR
jgi:hypothetical protein